MVQSIEESITIEHGGDMGDYIPKNYKVKETVFTVEKIRVRLETKAERIQGNKRIQSYADSIIIAETLFNLSELPEEICGVIALNVKNEVEGYFELSHGGISSSIIENRVLFRNLVLYNASGFILCHNHPSGDVTPSTADIQITEIVKKCADLFGITFLDHVIKGGNENINKFGFSFREHGKL